MAYSAVLGLASCQSPSTAARVSSSTNSGTPSARVTICSPNARGSITSPAVRLANAMASRSQRLLTGSVETCGSPVQCGENPGREDIKSNTGRCRMHGTITSSSSRLVWSIQCTSSNTMTTGREAAKAASCAIKSPSNCSLSRWARRRGWGEPPAAVTVQLAIRTASSPCIEPTALRLWRSGKSALGGEPPFRYPARAICAIIGKSGLS